MICKGCGAENSNEAKFCKECGLPVSIDKNLISEKPKAVSKKILIGACAIAIVLLLIAIFAITNSRATINLNDYLEIEANGYDGYGTVTAKIDWEAIRKKYGDKIRFTNLAQNELGGFLGLMTPLDVLHDGVNLKIEKTSGLSNGDIITYSWDMSEGLSDYIKCKIKCEDGSYNVSNLMEVENFDAFSDLEVSFEGIAPKGRANIIYEGIELDRSNFICDKIDGLSNGDVVTVSIDENIISTYVQNHGKAPASMEKEYTVHGLSHYLSKFSEVNDTALEAMKKQAEDVFNAYVAKKWSEDETLESFTYIGDYLLTKKPEDSSYGSNNLIYLVYKAQVRDFYANTEGDSYDKVNDIYWYIAFEDLLVDSTEELSFDISDYSTPFKTFVVDSNVKSYWLTKTWYYDGYETLDGLYKDAVTSKIDSYNHEDNVDESLAPKSATE